MPQIYTVHYDSIQYIVASRPKCLENVGAAHNPTKNLRGGILYGERAGALLL